MEERIAPKFSLKNWLSPVTILFVLYAIFFLPFWQPLLLAFLFSCALAPVTNYLHRKYHSSEKWTPIIVFSFLIIFVIGFFTFGGIRIYSYIYSQLQNPEAINSNFDRLATVRSELISWLKHIPFLNSQDIENQVSEATSNIGEQLRGMATNLAKLFVLKTPDILLNVLIFLLSLCVLLVWGQKKWKFIAGFPGMGGRQDLSNYHKFEKICAISIGSIFLTGFIQALIVGIGTKIAGYPGFLFFLLAFVLSLIPVVGAGSVPFVLTIISFANGNTTSGIILIVLTVITGSIDNVIRAYLFSRAANTNPVISLLSLLGGISLLGLTGLFLAPIVEQLVMSYLSENGLKRQRKTFPIKGWRGFTVKSPVQSV